MNVETLGAIADPSADASKSGRAPVGEEFEGVLRHQMDAEEGGSDVAPDASAEGESQSQDSAPNEMPQEELEAGEEQEEVSVEDVALGSLDAETQAESTAVLTGELGQTATVEQQVSSAENGGVSVNGRGALTETEADADESVLRAASARPADTDTATGRDPAQTAPDAPADENSRPADQTEALRGANESGEREQAVFEAQGGDDSTRSIAATDAAATRGEIADAGRTESLPSTAEERALASDGADTGDRRDRESSEEGRSASPAEVSRENLTAEAREVSNDATAARADRGVDAAANQAGAEAASTTPVSAPLVAAPLAADSAAAPGSPIPPPAADAVAVQTEWLVSRGGGAARLVLHPPELGEIAIRVTVRDGVVDVVMVAQEGAAKAIAEQQGDRLAQAFSNRDLRMENFEVRRGDAASLGNEGDPSFREPGAGQQQADEGSDRRGATLAGGENANGFDGSDAAEHESVIPQIVSIAPARGVDLRI